MLNNLLKTKWYHVRTNKRNKTIKITQKHFNTRTEGLQSVKTGMVLKPSQIQSMLDEGWTLYKEPWKPLDLHDEQTEADIKAYEAKIAKKKAIENRLKPKYEAVEPFNYDAKWRRQFNKEKREAGLM